MLIISMPVVILNILISMLILELILLGLIYYHFVFVYLLVFHLFKNESRFDFFYWVVAVHSLTWPLYFVCFN